MKKLVFVLLLSLGISCSKSGGNDPEPSPQPDPSNTAPSVPLKVFPTDGLLCTDNPLVFSWNVAVDKEDDAISYDVEVSTDAAFTEIVVMSNVTSTTVTYTLDKGVALYWRLRGKDAKNAYGEYSPVWQFYTEGEGIENYLPFVPTLEAPEMNTVLTTSTTTLNWNCSDVDNDNLVYDIYFGTSETPVLLAENIDTNTYQVDLLTNSIYYWKVVARDGNGGGSESPVWQFSKE